MRTRDHLEFEKNLELKEKLSIGELLGIRNWDQEDLVLACDTLLRALWYMVAGTKELRMDY